MNDLILQTKLDALRQRLTLLQRRKESITILLGSTLGLGLMYLFSSLPTTASGWLLLLLLLPMPALALCLWLLPRKRLTDAELARRIEARFPNLNALLLTAAESLESGKTTDNPFVQRIQEDAAAHGAQHPWVETLTGWQDKFTRIAQIACALLFFGLLAWIQIDRRSKPSAELAAQADAAAKEAPSSPTSFEFTLAPGDTEIEKGSRLVVEAKVSPSVPETATLILTDAKGTEVDRVPMRLTVDAQVFGGLFSRINQDGFYHVESGTSVSKKHRVTTFVYPALERADVKITPPVYSGLPPKEIKNTLKVTALEGSELTFSFKVNKPVKEAELFGEDKTVLPLKAKESDPLTLVGIMKPEATQKWRLHLVDDKERANKNPPWISVTVQSDQLAKIEVIFPKRDVQVSAIQEMPIEAKVWDDLSVVKSGAVVSIAGQSREVLFKQPPSTPAKKIDVRADLLLEKEKAEPKQLVSYYFWAEDKGPRGEVRRAMSDMFFADVRDYEDIFREQEAPPSDIPAAPSDKLLDLQKQVVNATWRVIRETGAGRKMEAAAPDVATVHDSQQVVLDKTKEAMEEAKDAGVKQALTEAWKSMKDALTPLAQASQEKKKSPLNQALGFEQSALEWLHRANSREHTVIRSEKGKGQSASQQIMSLELKQKEQRYEEQKQASEEMTAEQQQNLQVLNRLKELARRQEALAEKMKQLQNQMAKAKTEEEKQELANQLKRLQDEQEQLLRDVDELKERLEQPENAANMAEAKEQLEQTRQKVEEAAEKLKEEKLADAANSATRAQRDLEQMQEDFRQKTSRRFSDEMKQLRDQSRQVAERQKQISDSLENQKSSDSGEGRDTAASLEKRLAGSEIARELGNQIEQVSNLLENMQRISEQAEGNNPLLHRSLYEAVRQAETNSLKDNLKEAHDESRYGNRPDAQEAERKATASIEELRKGVEKAADSILGSETESLRLARKELDKLINDAQQEASGGEPPDGQKQTASAESKDSQSGDGSSPDKKASADGKDPSSQKGSGQTAQNQKGNPASGKEGQPGESPSGGEGKEGQQPGQGSQPGQQANAGQQSSSQGQGEGQGPPGSTPGQQPGKGDQPGQGQGSQPGQQANAGQQPSSQGQGEGQGPPGSMPGQQLGKGDQPGQSQGQGQGGQGTSPSGQNVANNHNASSSSSGGGGGGVGSNQTGDDRRRGLQPNVGSGMFFDESAEQEAAGPIAGSGYEQWSDRLRNVEELLSQPELRNNAARVLDNARAMRIDRQRNNEAPQAAHLETRIIQPLAELRDRVLEELSKRDTGNPAVPVDRDPVPPAYRDLVRRYYTELGAGQ